MVHRCLTTIQLRDFLSANQMVTWIADEKSNNKMVTTWITDKKFGNWKVTTIQLMDY